MSNAIRHDESWVLYATNVRDLMSRLRRWARIKIARLRYLMASFSLHRVEWIAFSRLSEGAVTTRRTDPVVVLFDGPVRSRRRLARRLAAALDADDIDMACGPVYVSGIRTRVVAAGYEVGHDGVEPFLIPLLSGEPLRRSWAPQISIAGRPSGRVLAVRLGTLHSLAGSDLEDHHRVVDVLRRHGSWLVVWSAAQESGPGEGVVHDHVESAARRREDGEGEIVEYASPTPESPGHTAPPPAAVWLGPEPVKDEPGVDVTTLTPTVAIRHAATDWGVARSWGDHHFSTALVDAFARRGIGARVAPRHVWGHPYAARRLVISLRGLVPLPPVVGRTNMLWVISHPEELTAEELRGYDMVAVASPVDLPRVASMTDAPTFSLLQAADPGMRREVGPSDRSVVFVGNSRGVARKVVTWAVEQGLHPMIYGSGWEGLIDSEAEILDPIIPETAADRFNTAGVVLGDHWDDMRRLGYVSNRVFDVAAAGGVLVTDRVAGIEDLVPWVHVYDNAADLGELVRHLLDQDDTVRQVEAERLQRVVLEGHTFDHRVDEILATIGSVVDGGAHLVESLPDPNRES